MRIVARASRHHGVHREVENGRVGALQLRHRALDLGVAHEVLHPEVDHHPQMFVPIAPVVPTVVPVVPVDPLPSAPGQSHARPQFRAHRLARVPRRGLGPMRGVSPHVRPSLELVRGSSPLPPPPPALLPRAGICAGRVGAVASTGGGGGGALAVDGVVVRRPARDRRQASHAREGVARVSGGAGPGVPSQGAFFHRQFTRPKFKSSRTGTWWSPHSTRRATRAHGAMAGDAIDPSYDDDDFEVSDDDDVEMASAVKPRPEEIRGTHSTKVATAPGGKTPGARRPSGSLTADLRSVAAVNASSPARGSSAGQPRAVALLARRSASKDSTVKKITPHPTNAAVQPKIPSDTAQMRLSSAFEKTLDTWHDRDGVAAENLALQTQIDAQLAEMAGLTLKCQSLEAAARADRERAADHARGLEDAVNKERKLRVEAERAAADVKAASTPWGQMAKGAMDVKCVSVEEAESMRREIQTQDAIMRGYQKENETATATINAMRREFALKEGDFNGQIDRLNGEIARLRLETERTGGDGARYLERQLAAEAALKTAQLEFAERERELVRERDAARAAARAAEAKMAGGGMEPGIDDEQDDERGGTAVEAAQLAELERRHGARVAELEKRIAWFTENQELVADRDANLRRQSARIEELDRELARARRELAKFQPAAGVTCRANTPGGTPGKPADVRDVSSAGVASLLGGFEPGTDVTASAAFDAGLAKNPQSVAALVRAVRPTEAHVEKIAALEARCRRLQDELDATDGEHERALRALQQEHLKFKSNTERRLREAEEFGRNAQGLGGPRAVGAKPPGTKALERQVHELQGEVDTLRARLKDAEAAAAVRTGPVSERPAAPARKPPKRSASTDKENADAAAAVAVVAASPVFKAPIGPHNPLANDPLPEGHPAVTPFDPTGAGVAVSISAAHSGLEGGFPAAERRGHRGGGGARRRGGCALVRVPAPAARARDEKPGEDRC